MKLVYTMTWCDVIQCLGCASILLWKGGLCSLLCLVVLLPTLNATFEILHFKGWCRLMCACFMSMCDTVGLMSSWGLSEP